MLVLLLKNPTFYNKNKFINLLSSDDQKTALTIRNGLVRAEFVAGRLLLMECIHRFDKGKTIEEKIIFNKNGKPFFSKSEIKFNISHTNKLIACAMGNNEMGIDVEDKKRDISSLASTILNTKQIKKYRSLNLNDRKQYLLKQWVLLEACSKLTGKGISQIKKYKKHAPFFKLQKTLLNHHLAIVTYNSEKISLYKVNKLTFY